MKSLVKYDDATRLVDVACPTINSAYDVKIQVAMTGICRTDIYASRGLIPTKTGSLILGHELSGTIASKGDAVENLRVGDRITAMPVFPNKEFAGLESKHRYAGGTMLGVDHDGSFCEEIVLPAASVYKLPDNLSFKHGAYLEPIAASLAVLNADLDPRQRGLIYGDGRIAQLTKRVMQAEGYQNVATFDPAEDVAALVPNTYDYIIETTIDEKSFKDMLAAVKPGGKIVFKSRQFNPVPINVHEMVRKDVQIRSVYYGDFQHGMDLLAQGRLNIDDILGPVYPLEEYEHAFALSQGREAKKIFLSATAPDVWNS